jgi:leader peptidase (prepilin peptidase)/N-methyltransferase
VTLSELPPPLLVVVAVTLGLLFGSFLNVVIHRLPRGENIAFPPSRCPACGAAIKAYDNVPVLSWLVLRGAARCCGARIALRYPAVELIGGLLAWAIVVFRIQTLPGDIAWYLALLHFAIYLALGLGLVAALFIDLDYMILPDSITLGGTALGLVTIALRDITWNEALLGAALGFLLVYVFFHHGYRLLRGQPGMGLGDAKLLLLAGAWFGWQGVLFALGAGAVQGTLFAVTLLLTRGKLEEPAAVQKEREQLRRELERLPDSERRQLERELEGDILLEPAKEGVMGARLAFGPFLALAIIEFMLAREWIEALFLSQLWQV